VNAPASAAPKLRDARSPATASWNNAGSAIAAHGANRSGAGITANQPTIHHATPYIVAQKAAESRRSPHTE